VGTLRVTRTAGTPNWEVRGLGPMLALEFVTDQTSRTPASALVDTIITECRQRGVLLIKAGLYGNVLRFLVPLVISDDELERALQVLDDVITSAAS